MIKPQKAKIGFVDSGTDTTDTRKLDLNKHLIKHPAATFFIRARGNSMILAGIHNNDLLVVDRALTSHTDSIAVVSYNGELLVRKIHRGVDAVYLTPANPKTKTLRIEDPDQLEVWGIVIHVIHSTTPKSF